MNLVHLTASRFFGGPERQMLALGRALPQNYRSSYLAFREDGFGADFVGNVREAGFPADSLDHDTPHFRKTIGEIADRLRATRADVLVTHGYKSNLLGRPAARRVGIPIVSVARGWTGENRKIRVYDAVDGYHLRYMDRVVCVSEGHARTVAETGLPSGRMRIIRNAARLEAFDRETDPVHRDILHGFFPDGIAPGQRVAIAAGRLSPEKGFHLLVEAAATVARTDPDARFVLFGCGGEEARLRRAIVDAGLARTFVLGGFRSDLDRLLPWGDLLVLPSFVEGLPNVVLEASAAGIPSVATRVGGTAEVLVDGETGYLIEPGDVPMLADRLSRLLADGDLRSRMGRAARERVRQQFTFAGQAAAWTAMLDEVVGDRTRSAARGRVTSARESSRWK